MKNAFKKEKKSTDKLKFRLEKPALCQDAERILESDIKNKKKLGFIGRLFDDSSYETIEKMVPDELRRHIKEKINLRDKDPLEKYLTRLHAVSVDQDEIKDLKFDLAFNLFDRELYSKAVKEFEAFLLYYPSDKKSEFAAYLEILCLDLIKNDYKRDQTDTRDLVFKAQNFLSREKYQKYRPYVKQILEDAYKNLYLSERLKFDFYAIRRQTKAMQMIIDYMRKEIAPYYSIKAEIEELESDIQDLKDGKAYVPRGVQPKAKEFVKKPVRTVSKRDRF